MDNSSENILYILKVEMFLVHIFNTAVCCGKTNKTKKHGEFTLSTSDQESLIFGMLYTVWI